MTDPLRILHIEDDPADAELVRAIIESEQIQCDIVRVETGRDFEAEVAAGEFDMIFADYSLPAYDGLSALETAKEKCPDVPFIFITGKMGEELAIDTLKNGATDYVLKQRLSRLVPSVHRALNEAAERRKRRQAEEELRKHREHLEELVKERTTELQRVNEQLRASYKDMESFSYSASHDLRSPLISIEGFSKILFEDYGACLDDEGKHMLKSVRDNARKMGRLIEDILSFSRVSTAGVKKSGIDMEAMAKRVFDELRPVIGKRKLRFVVGALPPACGDLSMIRQVVVNFLSNAVKYTVHREEAVIEMGGSTEEGENIYYVRDNGIGYDMNFADRLFGLFQRLHGSKEYIGTGVGLAIVKRIVEKHGGRVWAEGKVDGGATFYFTLPVITGRQCGRGK